jgi:hypothetical protein
MKTSIPDITVAALVALLVVAFAALFIGALVSVLRSALSGGMKLVWIVFVVIAPFLGSLLWFLIGKANARPRASSYGSGT